MRIVPITVLALLFTVSVACAGEHIKIEDVPEAARKTIDREVAGGTITKVERETEHGQTVYEVEYTQDKQDWEIEVRADGKLLEKKKD